jgi:hypothetical protein
MGVSAPLAFRLVFHIDRQLAADDRLQAVADRLLREFERRRRDCWCRRSPIAG